MLIGRTRDFATSGQRLSRQRVQRDVLGRGQRVQLPARAGFAQRPGRDRFPRGRRQHGARMSLAAAAPADGLNSARREVRLQRGHGHPPVLAGVHAVARVGAADGAGGQGQAPGARQRQPARGVRQRDLAVHAAAAGACLRQRGQGTASTASRQADVVLGQRGAQAGFEWTR
jgi:hypothetical protein